MAITRSTDARVEDPHPFLGTADRRGDQPPLTRHQIRRRELAELGRQHVRTPGEPISLPRISSTVAPWPAAAANSCNTTRSSKLFARSVNPCGPASRSPNASSSETSWLGQAVSEPLAALLEQFGDLLASEPKLARAGLDLFAPGVGVDPVLLAIAGRERRRLPTRLRIQADPAQLRSAQHLLTALRKLNEDLRRHTGELGGAFANLPPLQAQLAR